MKRKINAQLMMIAGAAIVVTTITMVCLFYQIYKEQVAEDLKTYVAVLNEVEALEHTTYEWYKNESSDVRVTVIKKDGNVLYDSSVDASKMENHRNRPEVKQAFAEGEGEIVRKSDTLGKSTFYYAQLAVDGTVIRVGKETNSIYAMFVNTVFLIVGLMVVLFLLCSLLSHLLTNHLLQPIEQMAERIEHNVPGSIYKELVPFISTIRSQHADILKSAKIRQEFTANVSHELKTPLTSISGYAELIGSGMTNEEDTIRFANEIQKNSKRLLTLINDIIELSELDEGNMEVAFETIDLYQIATECVQSLQMNAEKHEVLLRLTGENCMIFAGRAMIEELVYNLCDNALRYNYKGGRVEVYVGRDSNEVILQVKDTGIGISEQHQKRIFERFYRVDKSRSKLTGGTGLGLAIVKHIVAQHHAELELESEEGKGTCMRVRFYQTK